MAEGARIAEGLGAAIIDINMGCPAKQVTTGYSGSALMRNLDHALSLIEATIAAVAVPVTLKMRLGWDEYSLNAPELARRAEGAGVQLITVHGRTRCQFYNGKADWPPCAQSKRRVHPGHCHRRRHHLRACRTGARCVRRGRRDGGRGAEGRPWFPGQLARYLETGLREAAPPLDCSVPGHKRYTREMLAHHGAVGLRHARKHLGWALKVAAESAGDCKMDVLKRFRARVLTAERPSEAVRHLKRSPMTPLPGDRGMNRCRRARIRDCTAGQMRCSTHYASGHHGGGPMQDQRTQVAARRPFSNLRCRCYDVRVPRTGALRKPLAGVDRASAQSQRRSHEYKVDLGTPRNPGERLVDLQCGTVARAARSCGGVMLQERTIADKMDRSSLTVARRGQSCAAAMRRTKSKIHCRASAAGATARAIGRGRRPLADTG